MAQMASTETPRNGTSHHVGLTNRSANASAVPKSVTNVEAMMSLPSGVSVSPVSNQHGVDQGQRRRREGDAGDLRRRARPAEHPRAEEPGAEERRCEGNAADQHALLELLAHHARIDLRAGEERQEDAAEGGEEIHPRRARQAEKVARDDAEADLDQGHGDAELDRGDAGDE